MGDLEESVGAGGIGVGVERPAGRRSSMARRAQPNTSRSRSSSRGPQRLRTCRPNARSIDLSATSRAVAPVAGSGPLGTSRPTTALRNSGWSVTPTGSVAYSRDTPAESDAGQRRQRVDRRPERARGIADVRAEADVRPRPPFACHSAHLRLPRVPSLDSPDGRRRRHHPPHAGAAERRSARARAGRCPGGAGRLEPDRVPRRRGRAGPESSPVRRTTARSVRDSGHCSTSCGPDEGSSCSGRGRCRSRRRRTAWRSWRPRPGPTSPGARQQPLLGRRRRAVGMRRSPPSPTCRRSCRPTTPCPAGSRRSPASDWPTCVRAGGSPSISTRPST